MAKDTVAEISAETVQWVKSHAKEAVERFAGSYPSAQGKAISIFMAGSPGAGKTELSKNLVALLEKDNRRIVRIDPDEIREWLPMYIAGKAELFQSGVAVAVEKIHDHVLTANKHFLLDGTSAGLDKLRSNILRSLDKDRAVVIEYVYQDPDVAWDFTQKREQVEGRNIPKHSFVDQLFAAYANVETVKQEFGERIEVDLIQRNIQTGEYMTQFNIHTIAEHLSLPYTKEELAKRL
ncbi:MAG: zeta toxin family protein [Patescibacteria group bacterium]